MKLYDTGVYLHNGQEIIPAAKAQLPVSRKKQPEIPLRIPF